MIKNLYQFKFWNMKDSLEFKVDKLNVLAKTDDFFIVKNNLDVIFVVERLTLNDRHHQTYYTSYEEALGAARKQAYSNIEGLKESIFKFEKFIEQVNQKI